MRKTARHHWTTTAMLAALRRLAVRLGRTPSLRDLITHAELGVVPSSHTLQRRCGSLREAQRLAGCSPNGRGGTMPRFTRAQMLAHLCATAQRLGHTPRMQDLVGSPRPHTYIGRFGSWSGALVAAGLPLRSPSVPRTHCQRGHALTPANVYTAAPSRWFPKGYRRCRLCTVHRDARYRQQRAA